MGTASKIVSLSLEPGVKDLVEKMVKEQLSTAVSESTDAEVQELKTRIASLEKKLSSEHRRVSNMLGRVKFLEGLPSDFPSQLIDFAERLSRVEEADPVDIGKEVEDVLANMQDDIDRTGDRAESLSQSLAHAWDVVTNALQAVGMSPLPAVRRAPTKWPRVDRL